MDRGLRRGGAQILWSTITSAPGTSCPGARSAESHVRVALHCAEAVWRLSEHVGRRDCLSVSPTLTWHLGGGAGKRHVLERR